MYGNVVTETAQTEKSRTNNNTAPLSNAKIRTCCAKNKHCDQTVVLWHNTRVRHCDRTRALACRIYKTSTF